jgi:SAM-dependent methyltransferase
MSFKDHFSAGAADYASFRPTYPEALFSWLAGRCAAREVAWDCATGSGQAAAGLARHFAQVIATDASAEQITHASAPGNVHFRVATAECSGLAARSLDLVTVAQAAHWFDLQAFHAETRRVLKPAGMVVLWGYGRLLLPDRLDAPLAHFYGETVGPYWPPERKFIDDAYRSLPFPFAEIDTPPFAIEVEWDLHRLMAYLATWSAVKRYQAAMGKNPLPDLEKRLAPLWGDPARPRALKWPLFLRAGLLK